MSKRKMIFKKNLVAHALILAFGAGALTVGVAPSVMAQSNAAGTIYGGAKAGSTIQATNTETGLRRSVTVDSTGRFQLTALPIGTYNVTLSNGGKTEQSLDLNVSVGQSVEAVFSQKTGVQVVEVSGARRKIDVSNTASGATFSARELQSLPVRKNVEAIIQLAPNTTRADPRFVGNAASIGGGAATENAFYINGVTVTNPLTGFGTSQLPFGAIAEAQVLSGGYGAEFGRSIGGIVNIITKSGTNKWETGVGIEWAPNSLRAKNKNIYYPVTGRSYHNGTSVPPTPATDGTLYITRQPNTSDSKTLGAFVSGPIIHDKLFMFLSAEQRKTDRGLVSGIRVGTSNAKDGWNDIGDKVTRYLGKIDWNITDDHRLELMAIGDDPVQNVKRSGFDYATMARVGSVTSEQTDNNINDNGTKLQSLRYVGNVTPDFTVTAVVARAKSEHTQDLVGYNPSVMAVTADPASRVPGLSYTNAQSFTGALPAAGANDDVKSMRLDLEYRIGAHTIRGGLDRVQAESVGGTTSSGGGFWTYLKTDNPNIPQPVTGGIVAPTASGGGYGAQGYYVSKGYYSDATKAYGEQKAFYLEDKYQITKNLALQAGLRFEEFSNSNKLKQKFLDQKAEVNPRLSLAWDVNGDASLKLYSSIGRYSVPIPTQIGLRPAGATTNTTQYFAYTGTDANGQPQGLKPLSEPLSGNNEFGVPRDPKSFTATNMKPTYQDELILGMEKAISPEYVGGARATYRTMRSTIDDLCDSRPFAKWAKDNNVNVTNPHFGEDCYLFNPGIANTFYIDVSDRKGDYRNIALSAADLKFEKAIRTYTALDLFLEHPLRNNWYGKVNYTWSRSYGNTEGQVRSDNAQTDVSVTAVWDYPEVMIGGKGLLPNDRTHQLKAYGFYKLSDELSFGGNLLVASGRPRSCLGSHPNPEPGAPNYSNQAFWCYGETRAQNVVTPRGTLGKLPTDKRLDLNVTYQPNFFKGIKVRFELFNVFNSQVAEAVQEAYNSGTRMNAQFERVLSYSAPRAGRMSVEYNHKFN